ncbi:hypothetical protein AX16_003612 [Volvariella volvacea WC 439]|nr:hypothetical protein AX16_003612 [Volvariella volvacea WC 439]
MSSVPLTEKDILQQDSPTPIVPPSKNLGAFAFLSPFANAYDRFSQWRTDLGLSNPGSVENLQKEVKTTHLTNFMFDGGRADLAKVLSANPLFQVTHTFSLGSQTAPSSYNFGAIFATPSVSLHGSVDHDGGVNARFNRAWTPNSTTKVQAQFSHQPGHNMIQLEHDYLGQDFSANIKAINPGPTDLTGIYLGNYLQSVTKNLAIGFESLFQRQAPGLSDISTSYLAKWTSDDKNTITTAQIQSPGVIQTTYWQKLSEKVEVAADLHIIATPTRRDAIATLGAKYDLRLSTFRAQLDSTGKVSAYLEQRFTPAFAFLISGEIDHFKNAAKVGVGVMIESSTLTPEEMQMPAQPPL